MNKRIVLYIFVLVDPKLEYRNFFMSPNYRANTLDFTSTVAAIQFIPRPQSVGIHSFHAYELMLGWHVFRQTGPPRRVD